MAYGDAKLKYKTAMNVPLSDLTVVYNGEPAYIMSPRLLDGQDCLENLEEIIETHQLKLSLYVQMNETNDPKELRRLAVQVHEVEFKLQDLWKFERNKNFHKFWEYPKCTCPTLDNYDRYPYGYYVHSGECLIHGKHIQEIKDEASNV